MRVGGWILFLLIEVQAGPGVCGRLVLLVLIHVLIDGRFRRVWGVGLVWYSDSIVGRSRFMWEVAREVDLNEDSEMCEIEER